MSDGIARVQDRVESAQPIAHERMRRGTQRMRPREPASTTNAAPMLLLSDSSPGGLVMKGKYFLVAALIASYATLILADSPGAAIVMHLASRLVYVATFAILLRLQHREKAITRALGDEAYPRFKSLAAVLMHNDGATLVVLGIVTAGTASFDPWVAAPLGVALLVIGVGTKLWAIRTLGSDAFHYRSFFEPAQTVEHVRSGPYRWCRAPMYTLGYAHAYGVALVLLSWPALVAAAFDQLTILAFERWVERPHDRDALRASTAG